MWVSTVVAMKQNRRNYELKSLIQNVYLLCKMISSGYICLFISFFYYHLILLRIKQQPTYQMPFNE